ncbi:MAG: aldehyde dehydrogenase (NADP(+)) [Planctomycetaceae bacterium]
MSVREVLIDGGWVKSAGTETFQAINPATREPLDGSYPVSPWPEIERALAAAQAAFRRTTGWSGDRFAAFLEKYADRIEARADELVETAHLETALARQPRLKDVELPRTTNQLRQAAKAAREGSWMAATIDTKANIRSCYGPIGPVAVFGPNNFPFAFSGIAGGDFAAAVAAGNPVIAKGHSSHPGTTRIFAEEAREAGLETDMPPGFVQLIYRTKHSDGEKLAAHPSLGAIGYTGAREAGLVLKSAADRVGKPIYLELSSINPVVFLPGALEERGEALATEFSGSCLMGTGQFCTNPGLVILPGGATSEAFVEFVTKKFAESPVGTMLGEGVARNFASGIATIAAAGAKILTGGKPGGGAGCSFQNTLLRVDGDTFLKNPEKLQTEAFGNGSLIVVAKSAEQMLAIAGVLEGNLTGAIYSHTAGNDDALYDQLAPLVRHHVGRLLNDKMPTGVAVSPAMNHGGPFPATGHPVFTSVGIPAAIHRFAMLQCYDNVRPHRLPPVLRDKNPTGKTWRSIDGAWTTGDVS